MNLERHTARLRRGILRLDPRGRIGPEANPDFLLIGAKRCGSTALFASLTTHPGVIGPRGTKGTHYFDVNHGRGVVWYRSSFPATVAARRRRGEPLAVGEASPYYLFHPLAASRIAAELPGVRLVAILRDPVTRAWSHYRYEVRRGFEDLSFADALQAEPDRLSGEAQQIRSHSGYESFHHRHHSYLARGRYAEQLGEFLASFAPEQILVLQSEAFFAHPRRELARVVSYLGLPPAPVTPPPPGPTNEPDGAGPMDAELRRWLTDYFQPHNERLYQLPMIDFRWG